MFSATVIHNDKSKTRIIGPTCWAEMTARIYQRIVNEWKDKNDYLHLMSIVYNVSAEVLAQQHVKLYDEMITAISFLFSEPIDLKLIPVPDAITIAGKVIKIKATVGNRSFGQAIQARIALDRVKGIEEGCLAACVAIYMQPAYDGETKFSNERAKAIEDLVLDLPIKTVFPIGFFFLRKSNNVGRSLIQTLSQTIHRLISRGNLPFVLQSQKSYNDLVT
jgi:hypothetical protein